LSQTYEVLKNSGWILEVKKSDCAKDVSKSKKYLGFIIDSSKMMVFTSSEKIDKITEMIKGNLKKDLVEVKALASILGKIVSTKPSHGPLSRICTRSGYLDIEEHVRNRGWKGC
jgi:hypothetical protein